MDHGIVVAGEALVDVVVDPSGRETDAPGGSPLNVAVGTARLDVPSTLLAQVGEDERGALLRHHAEGSGVRFPAVPTGSGRTSVAVARLDAAGHADYDFDLEWSLPRQELPPCAALHVGSLGTVLPPGREAVLDLVDQAGARGTFVSYDPNLRRAFTDDVEQAWADVLALGSRCDLVKLSDEDAGLLRPDLDPGAVARLLLAGERTRVVLLTRGGDGATAYAAEVEVSARPRRIAMVDTVGAGDAFMAGTLGQLADLDAFTSDTLPRDHDGLARLVAGAVEVAATTCERRGANPPRRSELPPGWPG